MISAEMIREYYQPDLGLYPEVSSVSDVSKAIVRQHFLDKSYSDGSSEDVQRQERGWRNIASLNPKYAGKVRSLQLAFDSAWLLDLENENDNPAGPTFNQVENGETAKILRDVLVARLSGTGTAVREDWFEDEECNIYDELKGILHNNSVELRRESTYPKLEGITPARIVELLLSGELSI